MIRAVIFDMDGVVTDSERIGLDALTEAGRYQGIEMDRAFLKSTMGMTFQSSEGLYHAHYPTLDGEKMVAYYRGYMDALALSHGIPLMKGVNELLDALDEKKIPRAIASSTCVRGIRLYLEGNGVYDRFTKVVSGDMCAHSKPAPDIFLKAAEELGVDPKDCLVLEDSPNGVKAGRAAGMQVCMIPDQTPYSDALKPYCDHVADSLLDVRALL